MYDFGGTIFITIHGKIVHPKSKIQNSSFMEYFWLIKTIFAALLFALTLVVALYSTYAERKVAAFLQDRLGPDRAGPAGILQPFADGLKMFFKEDITPNAADKFLFILGPCVAMTTALMTSLVIPWGETFEFFGYKMTLQGSDLSFGVLYVFAVVSLGVYGIMIGGWASNNKFSLLGAIRASSQMISYELAMGLSLIAVIMLSSSLSLRSIAEMQQGGILSWNIFKQPLAFIIFLICAFAETNRTPFDLPECETELVGGYHTEYSSMKLGFYLFSEYINMFISGAFMTTLFFGAYHFPGKEYLAQMLSPNIMTTLGFMAFLGKSLFFVFFFMWVRWTVPRFRYDQLMRVGWQYLIPLALVNIVITFWK
jgi:NADH-quinone oxidoreductase subunit H